MENAGFLSEEIEKYKEIHRGKNRRIFELCDDVNRYSHTIMWQIKVTNDYLPEILSACAYIRAMSSFQSVIILSQYGLINEAKIILRSLAEGMFLMVAIAKDKNYSKKIVEQDLFELERTCKAIKRNIIAGIHKSEKPTLAEIEKKIESIKAEKDKKNLKEIKKRDLSKAADLESYYDTIYHLLSGSVHINPRDLEQYIDLTEDRKIREIKWGPDISEIEDVLFAAVETMVFVLGSISNLFEIELEGDWETIHKEYKAFGEYTLK